MCNNSQVSGPSKAILLLLSLPPALTFPFLFFPPCSVCGAHASDTGSHTHLHSGCRNDYTIHSSVPCKEKSALQGTFLFCCLFFNLWSQVTLYTLPYYSFSLLLSLFILSNRLFIVENGFYDGIADFCFWNVAQVRAPGHPPCQERRRCSHYFIFFFFLFPFFF